MATSEQPMIQLFPRVLAIFWLGTGSAWAGEGWPTLPATDGPVEVPAQEWPLRPGARSVRVLVHFPGGKLANVGKETGILLTLHNWGGVDCVGTANPRELADKLNVIALCVNYLQSGPKDSIEGPEPYDFGYLQALDALRDKGYPMGRFDPAPPAVEYPDHTDLTYVERGEKQHPIKSAADWEVRRGHVLANLQRVMGPLPSPLRRVPVDVKIVEEKRVGALVRRKITYQSDPDDRVPAYLFVPADPPAKKLPAILCLHQTNAFGKDETAGLRGNPEHKYALDLAERGYITIVPDYPSFGEHRFDFKTKTTYASGSMKAIWDNIRALDVLETLPEVDRERIGVIGHSLGGHNGMFTAVFEPRIKVIVSSCGFTTFRKDDLPSWTGPRYMPRIQTHFGNDAKKVPFDFQEIVAAFAPRPFLACAAEKDDDFDVSGVREVMKAAEGVYQLHGAEKDLSAYYPAGKHAFPADARKEAYEFLDRYLGR